MLKKIISGGQTGADQGGLEGGRISNILTGGTAPKGWRTENGSDEIILKSYGLVESSSKSYPPRTRANVTNSDGTLIFGSPFSPGCELTARICKQYGAPYIIVLWKNSKISQETLHDFSLWLVTYEIGTLNVAGNRESKNPGIHKATRNFIIRLINLEKSP